MATSKEAKSRLRLTMVRVISSLDMDDIQRITANETKREQIIEQILESFVQKHPEVETKLAKHLIDSLIGNMPKVALDLRDQLPQDTDRGKLEFWHQNWTGEKEKSKRAKNIDSQFIFSKKMRIEQTKQGDVGSSLAVTHEQVDDSTGQQRRPHLDSTLYNSSCTITLGVPNESIKILAKLGSGSYGTVSTCKIEGISFLPSSTSYCCKEFKGQPRSQLKSFSVESSMDLLHPGIVRAVAHTRKQPWLLVFPFFNGGALGDLLEIVPYPGTMATVVAKQDGNGKIKLPSKPVLVTAEQHERAKSLCLHAPTFIHALVQALEFAHNEGVIHNDLHPWNIMIDFTADGVPRVGIIDWGLALRVEFENKPTNVTNQLQHKLRPWRADELLDGQSGCPWSRASDVYALAWTIDTLCKFCDEYAEWAHTDWKKSRASVDIDVIKSINTQRYLKKKKEERGTLAALDAELQRLQLHPERALRPLLEMTVSFFPRA